MGKGVERQWAVTLIDVIDYFLFVPIWNDGHDRAKYLPLPQNHVIRSI